MSTIKNDTFYEWIKGDHIGVIEKISSEENESGIDWIKFESGRRINRNLFGEFLLVSDTGVSSIEPLSPSVMQQPQPSQPTVTHIPKKEEESPISILLKSQKKKRKETIKLDFELELPPTEILAIMYDSFGDDLITEIYKMNLTKLEETLPNKFEESIKSHLKIK
jgi:hypothetical protein